MSTKSNQPKETANKAVQATIDLNGTTQPAAPSSTPTASLATYKGHYTPPPQQEYSTGPADTVFTPDFNIFRGASGLRLTDAETEKLLAPPDESIVQLRPDGLIYVPQVFTRKRLNEVIGVGHWALVEMEVKQQHISGPSPDKDIVQVYFVGALIIRGHFCAKAIGENEYHLNNPLESYATAYEASKSDCLTRTTKDIGIFSELWDPAYRWKWHAKYTVKVWVNGKSKPQYRRVDQPPFYGETGLAEDSPVKQEGYVAPYAREQGGAGGGGYKGQPKSNRPLTPNNSATANTKPAPTVPRSQVAPPPPAVPAQPATPTRKPPVPLTEDRLDYALTFVRNGGTIAEIEKKYSLTDSQRSTLLDNYIPKPKT